MRVPKYFGTLPPDKTVILSTAVQISIGHVEAKQVITLFMETCFYVVVNVKITLKKWSILF